MTKMFQITTLNGDIHIIDDLDNVREVLQIDRYHLYTLVRMDDDEDRKEEDGNGDGDEKEREEVNPIESYLIIIHPLTDFLDQVVQDYRHAVRIDNFMRDFDHSTSFNPDDPCMNELETHQAQTFYNIRDRFRGHSLRRLEQSYAHLIPAARVVVNPLNLPTFREVWKRLEDAVWNYLLNLSELTSTNLLNSLIELFVYFRRR